MIVENAGKRGSAWSLCAGCVSAIERDARQVETEPVGRCLVCRDPLGHQSGRNWVMDYDPLVDRLEFEGPVVEATQVGAHVRLHFDDGDLYLAWTQLGELDDVLM